MILLLKDLIPFNRDVVGLNGMDKEVKKDLLFKQKKLILNMKFFLVTGTVPFRSVGIGRTCDFVNKKSFRFLRSFFLVAGTGLEPVTFGL